MATAREEENGTADDATDAFGLPFLHLSWPNNRTKKKKKNRSRNNASNSAKLVTEKEALFYNLNHKRRGIALIFNHEEFLIPNLGKRSGTQADLKNLESCLRALDFEVVVNNDLKINKLESEIKRVAELDHSDHDCFVMCVLSHGEEGILFAKDTGYKPDTLWAPFTANRCKTLAGKPKLFFIQACQGSRLDGGITVRTQTDSSSSYKIPVHADFLIAYSTIPGFYSWRNTTKGSWFIQSLCAELREHMYTFDILTLLTFVNRRVAVDFESNVPNNYQMHAQKQIPCVSYMLTRLLKFIPKNGEI